MPKRKEHLMSVDTGDDGMGDQQSNATQGPLRAGVAKSDITTSEPDIAVHDPLFARVLVLDDGTTTIAIIAMDVVSIGDLSDVSDDFLGNLRARIEGELGIPGGNVLVNATHTHPPTRRLLCEDAEQVNRTFDAVKRARENMTPVTVGVGRGREDRIQINRTVRMKDGSGCTIRQAHPFAWDDEVEGIRPVDPEIGVLRIDRLDGTPFAVVFNFACHPLIGMPGGPITANYPGFACKVIEGQLGHDAMAIFLQGSGGDVTEVLYKDVNNPRDSRPIGTVLGLSTLDAYRSIQVGDARLKVVTEHVEFPRRRDSEERIAELERLQQELAATLGNASLNFRTFLPLYLKYALNPEYPSDYSYRYMHEEAIGYDGLTKLDEWNRKNLDKYLQNIRTMERLSRIQADLGTLRWHKAHNDASGEKTIAVEVQGIRIGDCVLISSPAEVLTEVCLNVKNASPHEYTFMAAFSNGYTHYGAPVGDYEMRGYEVVECMLAPEWQQIYEEAAARVLAQL